MLGAVWEVVRELLGIGALVLVPGAIFAFAVNSGMGFRTAGLLAAIGFAAVGGWNAHSLVSRAGESAELRRVMEQRDRWQERAGELAMRFEQDREDIRMEVDDAITEIQRASAEASLDRGACPITQPELDSLRRAFGYGDEGAEPSAPGKLDIKVP